MLSCCPGIQGLRPLFRCGIVGCRSHAVQDIYKVPLVLGLCPPSGNGDDLKGTGGKGPEVMEAVLGVGVLPCLFPCPPCGLPSIPGWHRPIPQEVFIPTELFDLSSRAFWELVFVVVHTTVTPGRDRHWGLDAGREVGTDWPGHSSRRGTDPA